MLRYMRPVLQNGYCTAAMKLRVRFVDAWWQRKCAESIVLGSAVRFSATKWNLVPGTSRS
jgi:hypothetical protein